MLQRIKEFWNKAAFWWSLVNREDEVLFIDALYVKGVEAYAFDGKKDGDIFVNSRNYRLAWNDFEAYQNKVKPEGKDQTHAFLREYVTGVAGAYVHGKLNYAEKTASDILNGSSQVVLLEHMRNKGEDQVDTTVHMKKGFDNAMAVMNKQSKLMETDETVERIKDIHQKLNDHPIQNTPAVRKCGVIEKKTADEGTVTTVPGRF